MPVVFPHANNYEIEDDVFRQAWIALLDGQQGAGPALPRLPSIKPLNELIETTTAPGNLRPLSLEYLLRTLVSPVWQTTMQATNKFLEANRHIIEPTPEPVVNPVTDEMVQGVQLVLVAVLNPITNRVVEDAQLVPAWNLIPNDVMTLLRQPTQYVFEGNDPWVWANHIDDGLGDRWEIPNGRMSRADVRGFCRNLENSDEACFIVVAAWGKMKTNHGQETWAARNYWVPVLRNIREQNCSRRDAYEAFRDLRERNQLPRMRPAYFTKLIFFMRDISDGYIMDQWTGKSIQLLGQLAGIRQGLPILNQGYVSDDNTPEHYELFNCHIESLAPYLGINAEECEQRLFSNGADGGRRRGVWRQYVKNNWGIN